MAIHRVLAAVLVLVFLFVGGRARAETAATGPAPGAAVPGRLDVADQSGEFRCDLEQATVDGVTYRYGDTLEVEGVCREKDFRDLAPGDAHLRGVRIGGRANQLGITICLCWARAAPGGAGGAGGAGGDGDVGGQGATTRPDKLKVNQWYRVRGKLADGGEQWRELVVAVAKVEPIAAAPVRVGEFVGRQATFQGIAEKGGVLRTDDSAATVEGVVEWPQWVLGKKVRVSGVVGGKEGAWRFEKARWGLVELGDQVGREVALDGWLEILNGQWCFDYGDQSLYLTDAANHIMAFSSESYGRRARVTGKLLLQDRPSLHQFSLKSDRDLVPTYVVKSAKVEFLEAPVTEGRRFRRLSSTPPVVKDGVVELVEETFPVQGQETLAWFYYARNSGAIEAILQRPTAQTLDVLARRTGDAKVGGPMRKLYAAMLAAANDQRGPDYLIASLKTDTDRERPDTLACLGMFDRMLPRKGTLKTDLAWAEQPLIDVMTRTDKEGKRLWADEAVVCSGIIEVLLRINSAGARKALVDYAVSEELGSRDAMLRICDSWVQFPIEDLRKMEVVAEPLWCRRAVLGQFVRLNSPEAVTRFVREMEGDFVRREYEKHHTPEIVAALRENLDKYSPKGRAVAQMLIVRAGKDPAGELLKLLADDKFADKTLVVAELAGYSDPRVVGPLARLLREGAADYFYKSPTLAEPSTLASAYAVENALEAIAKAGTKEAVSELIDLLPVDLSRFKTYIDRAGCQRLVAAHLIELTGESFGTDAAAWKKWHEGGK